MARRIVADHYTHDDGMSLLRCQADFFYRYSGTAWPRVPDNEMRAAVYAVLERAVFETGKGGHGETVETEAAQR